MAAYGRTWTKNQGEYRCLGLAFPVRSGLLKHFEAQNIEPTFYAPQWFLTLYIYTFPPAFVCTSGLVSEDCSYLRRIFHPYAQI